MYRFLRVVAIAAVCCGLAGSLGAKSLSLPTTQNAALRYWMAFALMKDPPADPATEARLEKVAEGAAPWDGQRLGPIIDQNREAILTMQRATKLPECNWGLEYDLGPETPEAHLAKARVLGRLNVLYGLKQAAEHQTTGAVDTWIAGLRFAQQMAQGSSLFGALVAKAVLISDLNAVTSAVKSGELDQPSMSTVATAVRALPEYGFDWGQSVQYEALALRIAIRELSRDPGKTYQDWFGKTPPASFKMPSQVEIQEYQKLWARAADAMELPGESAQASLAEIQEQMTRLNPLFRELTPSLVRVNQQRILIASSRQDLLKVIVEHKDLELRH